MTTVAVFVGSLHENSINRKLARALEQLLPEDVTFDYVDINQPLFNQDFEQNMPDGPRELKGKIEAADAILFVTPEYNRGVPGVLKNAIDWASRPHGGNSFDGKPVAIAGASGGSLGTTQAQQQLRNVLVYLNTHILGQPEMYVQYPRSFDEAGEIIDEHSREIFQAFIDAFVAHIAKFR